MSPRKKLVIATRNKGKRAELQRILDEMISNNGGDESENIELVTLDAFPEIDDVAETGSTFAENALLKARTIASKTGLPALADDSGLVITALNGSPGIYSARWSGVHGDDAANTAKVLAELKDLNRADRSAKFCCVVALAMPDGRWNTQEGELLGDIGSMPRGSGGFGYDPIFLPKGYDLTLAEIPPQVKDSISHRGKALKAIAPIVLAFLA